MKDHYIESLPTIVTIILSFMAARIIYDPDVTLAKIGITFISILLGTFLGTCITYIIDKKIK